MFNWEDAFPNPDVNARVDIFNTTISNILINFIPYEILTIDGKDSPWSNTTIKKSRLWKK